MRPLVYGDLASWYPLLDPVEEHRDEALIYAQALQNAATGQAETLLELGAGAGNNAYFLQDVFDCTLTDVSDRMLEICQTRNPGCEHLLGDMRRIRLERLFDVVFIQDAVSYMATFKDLAAAVTTAYVHTRPGGVALFTPDCLSDTFEPHTDLRKYDEDGRSLRCVEWIHDPDPADTHYTTDYAMLLRDDSGVMACSDRHVLGLFARDTWLQLLADTGFSVDIIGVPVPAPYCGEAFLCRRER